MKKAQCANSGRKRESCNASRNNKWTRKEEEGREEEEPEGGEVKAENRSRNCGKIWREIVSDHFRWQKVDGEKEMESMRDGGRGRRER